MPEPVATAHLTYTLVTTPAALTRATPRHPRRGRLSITIARTPDTPGPATCRSITLEVPTGIHAEAITTQPERIDTAYSAPRGRTWHILKNTARPDCTVFTCSPENPRREAVFDDTWALTLILDNIPLTALPGTTTVRITDDTAAASAPYTRHSAALPVTVLAATDDA
ncbi:hypothetical protein ACFQ6N_04735 [Kitasatospora sp. NPDC056446]|uniref:hypothetical protein n=1 Tax=Kitasatospora sp. NPDC056446 TaxID=3345819 RepID=UPI003675B7AC